MNWYTRLNIFIYHVLFRPLAWWYPPRPQKFSLTSQSRVLIFSATGLGDGLTDSIVSRALVDTYPGIYIATVAHHRRPVIAQHNPFISCMYLIGKGPIRFLSLLSQLRRGGPWDAILYLCCADPEARCLGYLLNRNATVGWVHYTQFDYLYAHKLNRSNCPIHFIHRSLKMAEQVGAYTNTLCMVYKVNKSEQDDLDSRLKELKLPHKIGVVFQLGGGGKAYRDWPVDHFVELAALLSKRGIENIFILGGPDHIEKAARFSAEARRRNLKFFDVVGKLTFSLAAALVERCQCLVTTDTGIMHLSFALGTPAVVLLHCALGAKYLKPLVNLDRYEVVELSRPSNYKHGDKLYMSSMQPDEVLPRVLSILERGKVERGYCCEPSQSLENKGTECFNI